MPADKWSVAIFEFTDYRLYLKSHLKQLPKKGRGELTKISAHLRVNTTLLSQVMAGGRELSLEQVFDLSEYLGHTELESEYFSLLVQCERAGTQKLKNHLRRRIELKQQEALQLSRRISHEKELSELERSKFYSSWVYSAIHLFTSLRDDDGMSLLEIAERFRLPKAKTSEILQFLLSAGLIEESSGRFKMGVQSTFVGKDSPELLKHHSNWRVQAVRKSESLTERELMFTGQVSLSRKDFAKIREQITELIQAVAVTTKDSKPDDVACLNIDWFWVEPS